MLGIAAHQLLAQRRIMLGPEARQVGGDLDGALVRREQVQDERDAAVADRRRAREAEEVLHARRDPWRLIELVVDRRAAAARQLEVSRREAIDESALVAELSVEQIDEAELA